MPDRKHLEAYMRKMLFIYNPRSGKGVVGSKLSGIIEIFTKAGIDVIAHPTQSETDAKETAMRMAGEVDIITAAGGDGTLEEVAEGVYLSGKKVPIGIIPTGSTNDFASSTEIPKDIIEAANNIIEGVAEDVDLGMFNDGHFIYIAAFGLFTDVSYTTDQNLKNVLGHAAYLIEAGKKLFNVPVYNMHVKSEEMEFSGKFAYGMITNGRSIGGIKDLAWKQVDLSDGLFEVTLVKPPENILVLSKIFEKLMSGEPSDYIIKFRTGRLEIEAEEDVAWTTDGESAGTFKKVEIENISNAISFIVPN